MVNKSGFKNIAFFYGHAASNIGDLAINRGQIEVFSECYPKANIHVVLLSSANNEFIMAAKESFGSKENVYFHYLDDKDENLIIDVLNNPSTLFSSLDLEDVDAVWVSSGEHLFEYHDNENNHSLFWRTFPLFAAKSMNKFAGVLPSTYGPFENYETKKFIENLLDIADVVGVRELSSKKFLENELICETSKLGLDPAFFIDVSNYIKNEKSNSVGIIMRSEGWGIRLGPKERKEKTNIFRDTKYERSTAYQFSVEVIEKLALGHNKNVTIFVQTNADKELSEAILDKFAGTPVYGNISIVRPNSVDEYLTMLALVDHVITSRFHAAILSILLKKRVSAVYFESHGHKMQGLFDFLGATDICHNLSAHSCKVAVEKVINSVVEENKFEVSLKKLEFYREEWKDILFNAAANASVEEKESQQLHDLEKTYLLRAIDLIRKEKNRVIDEEAVKSERKIHGLKKSLSTAKKHVELFDKAEEEKKALEELLKAERKQLKKVYSGSTYKIGRQVVRDYKRPLHWPILPIKILRIFIQHQRRNAAKKNLIKDGRISSFFKSKKELGVSDKDTEVLEQGLFKHLEKSKKAMDRDEASTKVKRICYILHNSLPYASGGYATRAHGVATGLSQNGFEVVCLTRPGFPLDIKNDISPKDVAGHIIDGISYQRINFPLRKGRSNYSYMEEIISPLEEKIREINPDLVIAASFYLTALPALIAARNLGIPFIYEIRGLAEITKMSRDPSYIKTPAYTNQVFMEAETANNSDHVLTLTNSMKDEMTRRGVDPSKITILPNSVDSEIFSPRERDHELAERLGIPSDVPVIGYIGTFVDYEGLEDLVYASGLLKDRGYEFRLVIVGSENVNTGNIGPITAKMKQYAKKTGLDDWLILPGRVPHDKVEAFYSLINIAPFPRKPWPVCEMVSPMKPLEALAMSKAVVVSSVDALSDMIQDGYTGLIFEKGNVKSLLDTLVRLVDDPALCDLLGENARKWVQENRSWRNTTKSACLDVEDKGLITFAEFLS